MYVKNIHTLIWLLLVAFFIGGCSVNPVTGRSELSFGEEWELDVGKKAYLPYRQLQGGDYVVDPTVQDYVNEVGQRLARVSDRKLPYEFIVLNNSVPNAWALPGGKIAINRGLLTELASEAELAAVLGHEIVHAAARHGAVAQVRRLGLDGLVIGAAIAGGSSVYGQAASVGAQLVNQKYGRGDELESDEYGMLYMSRAGYDPAAAIDLQQTFVRLSEGRQSDWISGLFASHPPSQQRVSQNRATAARLPQGGEIGADRYKKALDTLLKSKPAYLAYDESYQAYTDENYIESRRLLEKARSIEPREALFDLLDGDLHAALGDRKSALKSYNRAVNKYPDFFASLANRGALQYEMGNTPAAKKDLAASLKLLPGFAVTHYTLGRIALDEGDRQQALKHFSTGARSKSKAGEQSYVALLKLDLGNNPHKYIKARVAAVSSGELVLNIANSTSVPIRNIVVDIQLRDHSGRRSNIRREYGQTLAANKRVSMGTGISVSDLSSASARVVHASLPQSIEQS